MQSSTRRLDVFIVIVAVLVALAAILTFLVQRELPNQEGSINATAVQRMMDIAGDPFGENPGENAGLEANKNFAGIWVNTLNARLGQGGAQGEISIYFAHPDYASVSAPKDDFRSYAMEQLLKNSDFMVSQNVSSAGISFVRHALPIRAKSDCDGCASRGVANYAAGDVIGFKEIKVPYVSAVDAFVDKALIAGLFLVTAMLVLVMAIFPIMQRNEDDRTKAEAKAKRLEMAALTDPLTGLHNRRYFERSLKEYLEAFNSSQQSLGLIVMKINQFGELSNQYGHDVGEELLQQIARKFVKMTRDHDVLARINSDEFALIVPNISREGLANVGERFQAKLDELSFNLDHGVVNPSITLGLGRNIEDGLTPQGIMHMASTDLAKQMNLRSKRLAA